MTLHLLDNLECPKNFSECPQVYINTYPVSNEKSFEQLSNLGTLMAHLF